MLAALPVAACVLPGAAMTSAERECCKKMAEQCGEMGMAKSHPCCNLNYADLPELSSEAVVAT